MEVSIDCIDQMFHFSVHNNILYYKTTIIFITFRDFSMFHQIFFLPQVKRCATITYEHGTYKLPHELPNDLKLLGN